MYKNLLIESKDCLQVVYINNHNSLNALNSKVLKELDKFFSEIDEMIKVVVIKGVGKAFVAGADISEMMNYNEEQAKSFSEFGSFVFRKIEKAKQIVIASINGFALGGGCELAMACDLRIASEKAKFGQPEINLGIIPGFSGTQRLPRLVGIAKAKELIFTGSIINSEEALNIGLVNKVVEHDKLDEEVLSFANLISSKSSSSLKNAKTAINSYLDNHIDNGIENETILFGNCFNHDDAKEGMSAFIEKRQANFKN
jgi:enoyl-CoA hydratase